MIVVQGFISEVSSAKCFPDGVERVTVKHADNEAGFHAIVSLRNTLGLSLNQPVEILIQPLHSEPATCEHEENV